MSKVKDLKSRINKLSNELGTLQSQYRKLTSRKSFVCGSCTKRSCFTKSDRVSSSHWDYCEDYRPSDEFKVICPKCGVLNRFLSEEILDSININNLDFKRTIEETVHYDNRTYHVQDDPDDWHYDAKRTEIKAPYTRFVNL